ncbi:YadA-like family protein [Haemophilus parainfluenzae]|uniref:YadA-like family protein n=1 Tax=Haemophilus parainfluenzae TaxID=729 RepID=UPI00096A238D|nr:YadA-like family protein [Haemophilus parainfluenzae]
MKYELLKRTAIALFVGGVISTYAMAEDKPIEAAGNSFVKAIDAEITKQTEAVKTELTNSIAEKADKSAVDDINAELDARAKALKTLQEEKASVKDLNAISENVKEGFNSIQDKVHNLQEALAGDGTEEKPGLIKSVSSAVEELNDNIAKKANQADVEANKAEIAKFGAQTNSNAALLLTMAGKVDQNKKDTDEAIAKNASAIVNIRNKEVLQNARLDNHGERIDANKAAIDELAKATNESVTNLGNAVSGLDEDLEGTQDAVAENRKDIDANTVAIDKLKETQTYKDLSKVETLVKDKADKTAVEKNASRITDTRNKQALQNARLDNHGERIEANEAAIDELAKATNESVTNLGDTVRDLDADLAGTQDAVAENRKDIDKNASRITDTRNKQVLQNARLDNHSERITAAEVALDTKADKTELAAKADKTELANKADKNSVYSKSETDNKFALKADNSVVRAQATDINKLRTDVNAHTKRLDHLDNRVNKLDKDLKRGLAAQAALTGLFQPYTVGKANFTAAVGGYKSQTAVAIGTGYRYTQNIATKAGVAFTQGGGVTYNAGVNFEW